MSFLASNWNKALELGQVRKGQAGGAGKAAEEPVRLKRLKRELEHESKERQHDIEKMRKYQSQLVAQQGKGKDMRRSEDASEMHQKKKGKKTKAIPINVSTALAELPSLRDLNKKVAARKAELTQAIEETKKMQEEAKRKEEEKLREIIARAEAKAKQKQLEKAQRRDLIESIKARVKNQLEQRKIMKSDGASQGEISYDIDKVAERFMTSEWSYVLRKGFVESLMDENKRNAKAGGKKMKKSEIMRQKELASIKVPPFTQPVAIGYHYVLLDDNTRSVAQISILALDGTEIYSTYIEPLLAVGDYRKDVTGLTKADLTRRVETSQSTDYFYNAHATEERKQAMHNIIGENMNGKPITSQLTASLNVQAVIKSRLVIGCGVKELIKKLGITHPDECLRDVSLYKPYSARQGDLFSVAQKHLGAEATNKILAKYGITPPSGASRVRMPLATEIMLTIELYNKARSHWDGTFSAASYRSLSTAQTAAARIAAGFWIEGEILKARIAQKKSESSESRYDKDSDNDSASDPDDDSDSETSDDDSSDSDSDSSSESDSDSSSSSDDSEDSDSD